MSLAQLSLFEQFHRADPSRDDEAVVIAICEQILAEGEAEPPVDVGLLASLCGIADIEYRLQPWAGSLFQRDGALVASIRATDGLERRRFTILHEGGHTFLPDFKRRTQHRCKGPKTREEQLCDLAAAEMLLPRGFFAADLLEAGSGLTGIEQLADRYQASLQAAALRAVKLGDDEPLMLMVFRFAHKPAEHGDEERCQRKLRLDWALRRGPWPYPLPHKSASPTSPFGRAWEHELVDEIGTIDEVLASGVGRVHVEARRYGDRVLALVRPATRGR